MTHVKYLPLFRALKKNKKEFVYGVPVGNYHQVEMHVDPTEAFNQDRPALPHQFTQFVIEPHTIGRKTPWKDHNDVDIYEGDLYVVTDANVPGIYYIYEYAGAFCGSKLDVTQQQGGPMGWIPEPNEAFVVNDYWISEDVEVVGNIHTGINPDHEQYEKLKEVYDGVQSKK